MLYGDVKKYTATVDLGSLATILTAEQDITVTGVGATDKFLAVNFPAAVDAGIGVVGCRVKAANTITVRYVNVSTGTIDVASGSWTFYVVKGQGSGNYL